jgi:N-acetyl-alpha-D-muramate 1-phosphate uridylyltransferase
MTLCGVIFAAGEGTRLRPLTATVPKPLCPVGNVPLLDRALARLAHHRLSGPALVAVNACYRAETVAGHVGGRAYVSREPGPHALGTAGALGHLRDWIAGRGVLAGNADAYLNPTGGGTGDLAPLLDGWDGTTVRVLAVPGPPNEFGDLRFAGFSLIPADLAAALLPVRAELVTEVWRPAEREGRLEVIRYDGVYLDTGTPADLLAANLDAAGGGSLIAPDATVEGKVDRSVVGAGARVLGTITRSLVFPGGRVGADEHLVDAIRLGPDLTVQAHPKEAP